MDLTAHVDGIEMATRCGAGKTSSINPNGLSIVWKAEIKTAEETPRRRLYRFVSIPPSEFYVHLDLGLSSMKLYFSEPDSCKWLPCR